MSSTNCSQNKDQNIIMQNNLVSFLPCNTVRKNDAKRFSLFCSNNLFTLNMISSN